MPLDFASLHGSGLGPTATRWAVRLQFCAFPTFPTFFLLFLTFTKIKVVHIQGGFLTFPYFRKTEKRKEKERKKNNRKRKKNSRKKKRTGKEQKKKRPGPLTGRIRAARCTPPTTGPTGENMKESNSRQRIAPLTASCARGSLRTQTQRTSQRLRPREELILLVYSVWN